MQVFKAFVKIISKRKFSALMYIVIFMIISFIMSSQPAQDNSFKETRLTVSIIDMDNSDASGKLTDFIGSNHKIKKTTDDKDAILDSLYYQTVDYVLTINEGYEDRISKGETDNLFSNYKVSGTYSTELLESQLDQYIVNLNCYIKGGFSLEDALSRAGEISSEEIKVTTEDFSNTGNYFSESICYYFQYLAYIFIAILISCLCPALLIINNKKIRNRTNCSCVSTTKRTFQITLGAVMFAFIIWLIFMTAALILCGKSFWCKEVLLAALNSFVFMLVVLSLTLLISVIATSPKATDMIANTIGLGMSFLCGVFVPQELLGKGVINIAHFLPAFWYIKANNMLAGTSGQIFEISDYLMYIGVQILFASAIFSAVLLITKTKRQSNGN